MLFRVFLGAHILAGLTCVVTGASAAASKKRRGRHTRLGTIYYWSFSIVFVSASGLAAMHWAADAYLFVIGALAFGCASLGYAVRMFRLEGRIGARRAHAVHISAMGSSYIALLTAFYVDNGPHLPLLRQLPLLAFWLLPSVIGLPLVLRAVARYVVRGGTAGPGGHRPRPLAPIASDTPEATHPL